MSEIRVKRDLVANARTMTLLWVLPVAAILITGYFAEYRWIVTIGWTLSLLVMGVACLANARGCGRMHCYFTGPFFLIMAFVSLLYGLDVLPLGTNGWHNIGNVLLFGGLLLCVVPELVWGRYRRAGTSSYMEIGRASCRERV